MKTSSMSWAAGAGSGDPDGMAAGQRKRDVIRAGRRRVRSGAGRWPPDDRRQVTWGVGRGVGEGSGMRLGGRQWQQPHPQPKAGPRGQPGSGVLSGIHAVAQWSGANKGAPPLPPFCLPPAPSWAPGLDDHAKIIRKDAASTRPLWESSPRPRLGVGGVKCGEGMGAEEDKGVLTTPLLVTRWQGQALALTLHLWKSMEELPSPPAPCLIIALIPEMGLPSRSAIKFRFGDLSMAASYHIRPG